MRPRLKPLREQTIVITGATSGIGLATARKAARAGARVVLVARDEAALAAEAARIVAAGGRADYVAADVGERAAVRAVVEAVVARHGGFDSWVNNAGAGIFAPAWATEDADHERLFRTNYWGVVYGAIEALRHLRDKGGAIVSLGSVASDVPLPLMSAYTASKHAVKGFVSTLRVEVLREGLPVSVTLIKPAGVHSPFDGHALNTLPEAVRIAPPLYHPDVVADAILRAVTRPMREVVVGGAGLLQIGAARAMPALTERLIAASTRLALIDPTRPRDDDEGLHSPGKPGGTLGHAPEPPLRSSVATGLQTLQVPAVAVALLGGLALAAVARFATGPDRRRD